MHSTAALEAPPAPADMVMQSELRSTVPWRLLLVIVACGLLLRGVVMSAIWLNGGSPLIGDEGNYILSALPLSEGRGIPDLWLWIRAPGFIGFAAAIFALTGGSLLALNIAQVVLSGVLVVLAFFLGRCTSGDLVTGKRAGLWAAALVAFNPLLILSDNFFLSETLYLLWLLVLVLALVRYAAFARADTPHGWRWLIAAGVVAGLGILTRPNLMFYMPFVAGWLVWLHRSRLWVALGRVAVLAMVSLLVVLPWSIRNTVKFGHFILLDTVGSYVLFLDNTDLPPAEVNRQLNEIPNQGDRQSYAFERGSEWIMTHKKEFMGRTLNRIVTSWSADPFTDLRYPVRDKLPGTPPAIRDLYALSASVAYLLLTVLALAGLIAAPRTDLKWLTLLYIAAFVVAIGLSNNEFRYRLPVLGLTSAFAGYALAVPASLRPVRAGKLQRGPALALLLGVLFVLVSLPLIVPGLAKSIEARSLELRDISSTANAENAARYERIAALDRVYSRPFRKAALAWAPADLAKAIDDAKAAVDREPGDWRSRIVLVDLFRQNGQSAKSAQVANSVPPTFNAKMQEEAYRQEFSGGSPPAILDVGGDDLGFIQGFYVGEQSDSTDSTPSFTYRWSGANATMWVAATDADRKVVLRARALPGPNGEPLTVRWTIGGRDAGQTQMGAAWQDYTLTVPAGAFGGRGLDIDLSAQARRPSPDDRRDLAVAIDSVQAAP